jgi:hypothetical protein
MPNGFVNIINRTRITTIEYLRPFSHIEVWVFAGLQEYIIAVANETMFEPKTI